MDISKLFELGDRPVGGGRPARRPAAGERHRLGRKQDADAFMLQPGGIDAIPEFWNWINDGAGAGGVGLHGDFNMTGSYDEWEEARRLVERGERKLSDYGGELPGIEPPQEWKRYFDCSASSGLAAPVEPVRVRLRRVVSSWHSVSWLMDPRSYDRPPIQRSEGAMTDGANVIGCGRNQLKPWLGLPPVPPQLDGGGRRLDGSP